MGDLVGAEPVEMASLGLRLLRASEAVGDVRPVELPSSWRGRTAEVVGGRMCAVAGVLPRIEQAYADSGRALLLHARAVEDAQVLARRAADLRTEADRLSALSTWSGPDPGDALRMTAARWEAQAVELHDAAVRRCVAVLDEVAQSAPRVRAGAVGQRFRADAAGSVWGQLTGMAGLVVTAGEALGGNRAARDELDLAAKESWRVWEPFVELYQQLDDDRDGLLVGGAIGIVGFKGAKLPMQAGRPSTKNLVDNVELARAEALQEGRVRNLIELLGVSRRPYQVGDARIGLFAHEAMNGHAVRQHVAKSLAFLRWRADRAPGGSASSFVDARVGQECLDALLAQHRALLDDFMLASGPPALALEVAMPRAIGHGYVAGDPALRASTVARAFFVRVDGGLVLKSFYPRVR